MFKGILKLLLFLTGLFTNSGQFTLKLLDFASGLGLMRLVVMAQQFIRFSGRIGFAGQPLNLFVQAADFLIAFFPGLQEF